MQIKNAANVFPDPVGAEISVVSPAKICGQPSSCGSVGVPNRETNQSRTSGCAHSRFDKREDAEDVSFMAARLQYNAQSKNALPHAVWLLRALEQRLKDRVNRSVAKLGQVHVAVQTPVFHQLDRFSRYNLFQ